jgi:hypothetical protein
MGKHFLEFPAGEIMSRKKTDDISRIYVFLIKSKSAGDAVKIDNFLLFL